MYPQSWCMSDIDNMMEQKLMLLCLYSFVGTHYYRHVLQNVYKYTHTQTTEKAHNFVTYFSS